MCELTVRPAAEEDAAALADMERACFSDPWSENSIIYEIKNPSAVFLCARLGGELAGYAVMTHVLDEGSIDNIAVAERFRRRGVARALMEAVFASAAGLGLSFLTLEVRASNLPAAALYKSFGFEQVGLRKNYYSGPKEDAVLMTRVLREPDGAPA